MRAVASRQMRAIETEAAERLGLPTLLLMENAGRQVAAFVHRVLGRPAPVAVVAGRGNNGGDGLVAARHLAAWGYPVQVVLAGEPAAGGDAALNLGVARAMGLGIVPISELELALATAALVVDALLGTGMSGAPRAAAAGQIAAVNRTGLPVLAIDIPSGVDSDTGRALGAAIRATWTVTLGLPKRGLYLGEGAELAGEVHVADIGIPARAHDTVAAADPEPLWQVLTPQLVAAWLPRYTRAAHKGTRGRVLLAGGSRGMSGAAVLAAGAALRAGAGLVTLGVPEPLHTAVAARLIEVMTLPLAATDDAGLAPTAATALLAAAASADALALGPGWGLHPGSQELLRALLARLPSPTVIDADGLKALAGHLDQVRQAAAPLVLTPHPGEAGLLLGRSAGDVQADRAGALADLVAATEAVVVLKGADTLIGTPDGEVYVNTTGSRALATAGSGDVLTGVIAALLAQGLAPGAAAAAGVFLHGLAADGLSRLHGHDGLLAADLLPELPGALGRLRLLPRTALPGPWRQARGPWPAVLPAGGLRSGPAADTSEQQEGGWDV